VRTPKKRSHFYRASKNQTVLLRLFEDAAELIVDDRVISKKVLTECVGIFQVFYDVMIGGDGFEHFFVFKWNDCVWVINDVQKSDAVIQALEKMGLQEKQLTIWKVPWSWRPRSLGFLPLLPVAMSGVYSLKSLPSI